MDIGDEKLSLMDNIILEIKYEIIGNIFEEEGCFFMARVSTLSVILWYLIAAKLSVLYPKAIIGLSS